MIRYKGYSITFPHRYLHLNGHFGALFARISSKHMIVDYVPTHQTKWAALRGAMEIIRDTGRAVTCRSRRS